MEKRLGVITLVRPYGREEWWFSGESRGKTTRNRYQKCWVVLFPGSELFLRKPANLLATHSEWPPKKSGSAFMNKTNAAAKGSVQKCFIFLHLFKVLTGTQLWTNKVQFTTITERHSEYSTIPLSLLDQIHIKTSTRKWNSSKRPGSRLVSSPLSQTASVLTRQSL